MKKVFCLICISLALFCTVSCKQKQKKTKEESIKEFRQQLTEDDTVAMLRICDDAMEQLKAKQIDKVLASMYEYTDSTKELRPLSDALKRKCRAKFQMFPVLEYKRVYYSFMLEGCNDVKYEVVFATAEQTGTAEPARTAFMFNPVRKDGEWKLCIKTSDKMIDREMR